VMHARSSPSLPSHNPLLGSQLCMRYLLLASLHKVNVRVFRKVLDRGTLYWVPLEPMPFHYR
ncbi:MAG TPA: hypothetical protein VMY35_03585, partial [Phycisphaerae bacterium]|nr:hypothetical protein [Phycisphaerae bacterium]